MSTTTNNSTKEGRVMIEAVYQVVSEFYLPKGVRQEDVESYHIKYDMAHVKLKDGRELELEAHYSAAVDGHDFKYPSGSVLVDVEPDDLPEHLDDEEEEEEDEK